MPAKSNGAAGLSRDHRSAAEDNGHRSTLTRRERRALNRRARRLEDRMTGMWLSPEFDRRRHVLVAYDRPEPVVAVFDREPVARDLAARGYAGWAAELAEPPSDPLAAHLVITLDSAVTVVERRVLPMAAGGAS